MKSDCVRTVDPSAQGLTGVENLKIKKGDPMSHNTITTDERHLDSNKADGAPSNLTMNRPKKVPKTIELTPKKPLHSNIATNGAENVPNVCNNHDTVDSCVQKTGDAEIQSISGVWTQNQQKTLEWAIKQYPKGTLERWEKISEHITGKTKVTY